MAGTPSVIPVSDLRRDSADILGKVRQGGRPVIVTRRGRAAAVIMSMADFERNEREREILRLLARGEREIAAGKGTSLEQVLAEADRFLAEEP